MDRQVTIVILITGAIASTLLHMQGTAIETKINISPKPMRITVHMVANMETHMAVNMAVNTIDISFLEVL